MKFFTSIAEQAALIRVILDTVGVQFNETVSTEELHDDGSQYHFVFHTFDTDMDDDIDDNEG
jgi:hypothetical protein